MLGQRNARSALDHINLGFFANAVLGELHAVKKAGAAQPSVSPNLRQALQALRALPGVEETAAELKRGLAFRTYEEYCALMRVLSRSPAGLSTPQQLLGVLAWVEVEDPNAQRKALRESLDKVTVFFEALADEAVLGAQMSEEAALGSSRFST